MNSLECFKEEMRKRGMTNQQIESKAVMVALDILSNSDGELVKAAEYIREMREEAREAENRRSIAVRFLANKERERDLQYKMIKEQWTEYDEYIKAFNKSLEECETAEGRDRLRLAQMYTNSVNIETKYDQTAYIIGLASVISGGNIAPIKALKQINNKIPDPFVV